MMPCHLLLYCLTHISFFSGWLSTASGYDAGVIASELLTSAQFARYADIIRLPISVLTTSEMCIIWPVVSFKILSPNSTSWIN